MKRIITSLSAIYCIVILLSGCASMNKAGKGAVIGTASGAAAGAVVGKVAGNTAAGAIIGAAVGGATGAMIGHKMDKQAEEIKKTVPDAKVERVGEGIIVEFNSNILFALNSANLSPEAKQNLDKLVNILTTYSDTNIELQGHTDNTGTDSYNQTLSEKRAGSVSGYLFGKGVSNTRLVIKGFGETSPKYDNSTAEGRTQNRRVEFLITANEKMKAEAAAEANR